MKRLKLRVVDKTNLHSLKEYCQVVYVSNLINNVGIVIQEENIQRLENDMNIISYRESEEGTFQPHITTC